MPPRSPARSRAQCSPATKFCTLFSRSTSIASELNRLSALTVVVFAKEPRPGTVKTRLAEDLGERQASALYRCFIADLAEMLGGLDDVVDGPVSTVLAYSGDPSHEGFEPFETIGCQFIEQQGEGLGERLCQATTACFEAGVERLIIIGTDSPTLSARHFGKAFSSLEEHPVVIGPSFDGGYYLIGLNGPHTQVFNEIDWSTQRVLGQTLSRCQAASLLCEMLEFWYDIDTFDDLKLLKTHLFDYLRDRQPQTAPRTAEFIARLEGSQAISEAFDPTK